ncbi:MAG TPA: EutN/CcmL family microcompartment protein [Elusimicrobiales bacterium]|nr:EutN/CcmL family microcompartment protein [Elusimicrobiales bacterium]
MKQAKVIGRVFCSQQCCGMSRKTLLLVQPLDWVTDAPSGDPLVAADTVGAGAGETVFFVASREAIVAFEGWEGETAAKSDLPPVDAAIVGIIDGKKLI